MALKQTDPRLGVDINHFGCCFISILHTLEKAFGVDFNTPEAILKVYKDEENDEDLGAECFVNDPQKLVDSVVGKGQMKYLGHQDNNFKLLEHDFVVAAWYNKRTNFTHFVCMDGKGIERANVEFDPIQQKDGSGSITVKEGVCQSLRVFRRL